MSAPAVQSVGAPHAGVSLLQLYLLRVLYLVWGAGLAIRIWPRLFRVDPSLPVMDTVVNAVLAGLSIVAFLGVRHPLKMIPLLLFEIAWKVIWLTAIALPLWRQNELDAKDIEVMKSVLTVVIFPFIVPWGYVFRHYVAAAGDRWK